MGSITKQDLRYYMRFTTRYHLDVEAIDKLLELRTVAARLHRCYEIQCSEYLRDEDYKRLANRIENLEAKAKRIAEFFEMDLRLCQDPRGWPIHLGASDNTEWAIY